MCIVMNKNELCIAYTDLTDRFQIRSNRNIHTTFAKAGISSNTYVVDNENSKNSLMHSNNIRLDINSSHPI